MFEHRLNSDIHKEMRAFDALPPVVRKAFAEADMPISVYNTMRMPGFRRAYEQMSNAAFAATISAHFKKELEALIAHENA